MQIADEGKDCSQSSIELIACATILSSTSDKKVKLETGR